MWELSNRARARFAAGRTFLVVVKATFALEQDGGLRVADEQLPIEDTPRHYGDPTRSSLLCDADFALTKAATDVLLAGHAHTLRGRPADLDDAVARALAPAAYWGDVGAASGALFAGFAFAASVRGHGRRPTTLIWASSEGGSRAAALLRSTPSDREAEDS